DPHERMLLDRSGADQRVMPMRLFLIDRRQIGIEHLQQRSDLWIHAPLNRQRSCRRRSLVEYGSGVERAEHGEHLADGAAQPVAILEAEEAVRQLWNSRRVAANSGLRAAEARGARPLTLSRGRFVRVDPRAERFVELGQAERR